MCTGMLNSIHFVWNSVSEIIWNLARGPNLSTPVLLSLLLVLSGRTESVATAQVLRFRSWLVEIVTGRPQFVLHHRTRSVSIEYKYCAIGRIYPERIQWIGPSRKLWPTRIPTLDANNHIYTHTRIRLLFVRLFESIFASRNELVDGTRALPIECVHKTHPKAREAPILSHPIPIQPNTCTHAQ